jgi:hypothetical protein
LSGTTSEPAPTTGMVSGTVADFMASDACGDGAGGGPSSTSAQAAAASFRRRAVREAGRRMQRMGLLGGAGAMSAFPSTPAHAFTSPADEGGGGSGPRGGGDDTDDYRTAESGGSSASEQTSEADSSCSSLSDSGELEWTHSPNIALSPRSRSVLARMAGTCGAAAPVRAAESAAGGQAQDVKQENGAHATGAAAAVIAAATAAAAAVTAAGQGAQAEAESEPSLRCARGHADPALRGLAEGAVRAAEKTGPSTRGPPLHAVAITAAAAAAAAAHSMPPPQATKKKQQRRSGAKSRKGRPQTMPSESCCYTSSTGGYSSTEGYAATDAEDGGTGKIAGLSAGQFDCQFNCQSEDGLAKFEPMLPKHYKLLGDPREPSLFLDETLRLRGYGFRCQRQLALASGRVECFADQGDALASLDSVMANRTEHCLYNNRLCQLVRAGDAEELRQALQAGDCPNAHNKQGQTVSGSSPESCFARLVLHRPVPGARCAQTCRCCFHSTLALRRTCFRRVM